MYLIQVAIVLFLVSTSFVFIPGCLKLSITDNNFQTSRDRGEIYHLAHQSGSFVRSRTRSVWNGKQRNVPSKE